jgi:hypothetical protein
LRNETSTGACYTASKKVEAVIDERRRMMISRYSAVLFMVVTVLGVVVTVLLAGVPGAEPTAPLRAEAAVVQAPPISQQTDPALLVPESTMGQKPVQYPHNWDDNPVAYIPESTISAKPNRYPHNWDDNPVAYIPESTMYKHSGNTADGR